ncbi:MAG: O-antigen ligase family protein [bacterium]
MSYTLFLILICLVFVFLSWKKPLNGIYIISAVLPTFLLRFNILGVPLTILETLILLLFLICLAQKKIDFKKFYSQPFFWPTFAILFFATISIFTSPEKIGALGIWKAYFIEPVLFFIILISNIKSRKQLEGVFWALGASIIYLGLFGFWQKFSVWGVPKAFQTLSGGTDRVVSILNYPNAVGLYFGPIIILYVGWLFASLKNFTKVNKQEILSLSFKILVIIIGLLGIALAKSAGAVISVVVVLTILGLLNKKIRPWLLGLVVVGLLVFFLDNNFRNYLITKLTLNEYSGFIRRLIWQESFNMLKDNWLWGAGLDGYQTKILPYHSKAFEVFMYPHNIILNFWSEVGILGLLAFIYLGVKYFLTNLKVFMAKVSAIDSYQKVMAVTFIFVLVQMILHGLVDAPYFKNDLSVLFWIFMAGAIINKELKRG